ncbi:MAG: DNA polymerase IV [Candidatus Thorarchaeota archaeon]
MTRWIMHIDMDAFFASVEQYRVHPELQGLPVCVGHDPKKGSGRGVVRAASYEARAAGITSGMPVSKAYRLSPDAVFVSGEFSNYAEASDEFMSVLEDFADGGRVRRASIDEAYIEVTFGVSEYSSPRAMAQELQRTIKKITQLPCSIGVAPNMSVAKVATGMNKPLGITVVPQNPDSVASFLAPLKVEALNGVGKKTGERLSKNGIDILKQIQDLTITELWPIMGRASSWLHKRALGIDERPLIHNGPRIRKSISKDRTFMEDVEPDAVGYVHETIRNICRRIGEKLKKKALRFKTVTVKLRYKDYTTIQRSRSIPIETDDPIVLERLAIELFENKRDPNQHIRLIGVKVSSLRESKAQLCLTEFL